MFSHTDTSMDSDSHDAHEASRAGVMGLLTGLEQRFGSQTENFDPIQMLRREYKYEDPNFCSDNAYLIHEQACARTVQVQGWSDIEADPELSNRVLVLFRSISESYSTLVALTRWTSGPENLVMSAEDLILRFVRATDEKELTIQVVYKFILAWCNRLQLRHRGDKVFKQIKTAAGLPTHAWVLAKDVGDCDMSTLEGLVSAVCTKLHSNDVWTMYISVNTKSITDKLRICIEPEFPVLKTNRCWIAFSDGLYNVYCETFVPYDDLNRFQIPANMAVCAYHKTAFASAFFRNGNRTGIPLHPLLEVQTPLLDKILDTQQLCGFTKFWVFAQLGRLLYFANTLDSWQVCLMFKGTAGTGKSTLIDFMTSIYDPVDTVCINNDASAGFGLQALNDEIYLWCCGELKQDFNIDQAQFQQLVSQQRMAINRKYLGAFDGVIRAHGILAGNVYPLRWHDNAGSIRRRLFVINFNFRPPKSESDLLDKLRTVELPHILRKINWCYRHAVTLLNGRDIWQSQMLSTHIMEQNEGIYAAMNSLRAFLKSGHVVFGPNHWCALDAFVKGYGDYCAGLFIPKQPWSDELCSVPFKDGDLKLRRANFTWENDARREGQIVVGCCLNAAVNNMKEIPGLENPDYIEETDTDVDYLVV